MATSIIAVTNHYFLPLPSCVLSKLKESFALKGNWRVDNLSRSAEGDVHAAVISHNDYQEVSFDFLALLGAQIAISVNEIFHLVSIEIFPLAQGLCLYVGRRNYHVR